MTAVNYLMKSKESSSSIETGPMGLLQIVVVALCVLINAIDGFDVMVVAFTAAPVGREWALVPTQIGMLFSAGLVGMALGSMFLAPLGDRYGRRPLILVCQIIVGVSMLLGAATQNLWELTGTRFVTGIGVGGLLASINIIVAEYSSAKRRALCISLMSLGYPIGAALGGLISIYLIQDFGWRSVYMLGGVAMLAVIPMTFWLMPESLSFLLLRRDANTLGRVNRLLKRMGRLPLDTLPEQKLQAEVRPSIWSLLSGDYAKPAYLMGFVYCGTMFTVYFLLSWMPKILTEQGYSDTGGISVSLLMNIAGAIACLTMGMLSNRLGLRRLASGIFIGLFLTTVWFGFSAHEPTLVNVSVAGIGFFLFSSIAVTYAIVPEVFPPQVRLTAMGTCLAFGRLGGVLGPYAAGLLMADGWTLDMYCLALAAPALFAVIAVRLALPASRVSTVSMATSEQSAT